ncbi:MAG: right-handed parallel beta-helix repeat-containing protein [Bacteroidota bacterium]
MILKKQLFFIFLSSLLILSSCKKDELLTDSSAKLEFSTDSVLFDTVFTQVGSTTKIFRIYNRHRQPINISKAYLAGGTSSQFRLNIDGISGTSINDIEILGGDSLYAFVQVTVNPTGSNSPLIISESVFFETNGNTQEVILTAIGQDVYLHKPNLPSGNPFYSIINCNDVWTNDKPHLIFGYAVVDSNCTLTMLPGTRVNLHNKAVLWIYKDGTLKVLGSKGDEVTFQGDRLEPEYKELSGQWGKIWLSAGSKNNIIDWAIIKNGSIGVQADTVASLTTPTLQINNTIVKNMTAAAIYGQGAHIRSVNCVFANCGQYVAALTIGGKYRFEHCTFANFWTEKRTTPLLILNNYYVAKGNIVVLRSMDSAYFGNCILYGNLAEEIGLDSSTFQSGIFSYKFDHCILRTGLNTSNGLHYMNISKADPGFKDYSVNNYQLSSATAGAVDRGDTNIIISRDLNNNNRPNPTPNNIPDLGAYEYYP